MMSLLRKHKELNLEEILLLLLEILLDETEDWIEKDDCILRQIWAELYWIQNL